MTDNKQAATTDDTLFLAQNIINQIGDLWAEHIPSKDWVAVRQATNDQLDEWVSGLLAKHHSTLLDRLDEVTAERDALAAVVAGVNSWSISYDVTESELFDILDKAPSSVLAAHDAKVRAEALREAADDYRQQALPVNSELSMLGGAGPFVDKGIEGYMEAQHDTWDWLRARAAKEENR